MVVGSQKIYSTTDDGQKVTGTLELTPDGVIGRSAPGVANVRCLNIIMHQKMLFGDKAVTITSNPKRWFQLLEINFSGTMLRVGIAG